MSDHDGGNLRHFYRHPSHWVVVRGVYGVDKPESPSRVWLVQVGFGPSDIEGPV